MRERLRHHPPLRLALQPVVADRHRGVQAFLHVARFEQIERARVVAPHAGVAVGLQLHAHRHAVVLGLRAAAARGLELGEAAGHFLHVMRDLVRNHVGLREVPWRAELLMKGAEEGQIDVELLVARTVKLPHCRRAHAARRADLPFIEYERRRAVLASRLPEDSAPHVLGAAQHLRDELPRLVPRRALGDLLRRWAAAGPLPGHVHDRAGIDAQEIGHERDQDPADPDSAADHSHAAPVFDVMTCPLVAETHARWGAIPVPGYGSSFCWQTRIPLSEHPMFKVLTALASGLLIAGSAWAQDKQTAQQERMKSCNAQASKKEMKGDERKAFMSKCLSGDDNKPTAQQEKMKTCNAQASKKGMKGDERKAFMSKCLSGDDNKPTAQQEKMKTCNAQASKKDLKGDERKAFMSKCLSA